MRNHGVTFIELVIVLAICGILAVVAGASYFAQSNNQRTHAMKAALLHLEAEQASQLLLTRRYSSAIPHIGDGRFSLQVMRADDRDFTIKAVSHIKTGNGCDELIITSTSRSPKKCWE